jgi:GTP-binding protein Era
VSGDDRRATRCGFVAIVGAPNAGKSTLVNTLVGAKVSIVTPKVQTTRTRILGILCAGDTQLVFVDTPGIFAPRRRLDRAMVAAAWNGAADADEVVLLVDAEAGFDDDVRRIVAGLGDAGRSAVLALNKIDLVKRERLLGLAASLNAEGVFADTFMISAASGDGVDDLVRALAARAPEGAWHFPADQLSDMNERLFAAEVTREQLFLQLRQEVPYALTVETDTWEEFQDGSVKINQTVYLAREAHKAIVLGKGGARIKAVREAAVQELEAHWGRRVHLFVFVAVRENWGEDPERYRAWGLDFDA